MMENAVEFIGVSKRLVKGERAASLRDLLSGNIGRLLGKGRPVNPDAFWALKGLNLEVKSGEAVGIIGENGAGKTTMLKLIAGIMKPNEGELKVSGRVASLIELGAGFHPDLTGRENIYLCGSIMGMKAARIKESFDSIVSFAGIEEFLDTPIKRYSMGMFVRLGFSVAMHLDTDIMLIDEVLAVGDLNFQAKCRDALDRFKESGKTIIFVSHDLGSVLSLCSKVVWLGKGKIMEAGDPQKVVNAYIAHSERSAGSTLNLQRDSAWASAYDAGDAVKEPRGLASGSGGNILAASLLGHCVAVFSPSGKLIKKIGTAGLGDGKLYSPAGVAFDGKAVFVSDLSNACVNKYDIDGVCLEIFRGEFSEPFGLCVSGKEKLIVTDRKLHRVFELSQDGRLVNSFGGKGSGAGEFNFPIAAAADARGFLYISDLNNHRVQVYDGERKLAGSFGKFGSGPEEFNGPHDLVVRGSSLFIADHLNARVKKYDISASPEKPELKGVFGLERSMFPCGITLGPENELYLSFGGTTLIGKYSERATA